MTTVTLLSYLIATAIPLFAIYLMFSFDLFGTGKTSTLAVCLLWGSVSVFLALQVNNRLIGLTNFEITARLFGPISEEVLKSVILFIIVTRPRFRYIVDGAVYGFACGVGFAIIENVIYISSNPGVALSLSVARALSASLMHATTSALIGIGLGQLRRSQSGARLFWAIGGFLPAMLIHIGYNNIVNVLSGPALLLVAIGIGVMGFALISYQVRRGVSEEKKRFAQTLGIGVGVTDAERKAVQELGSNAIESILKELSDYFGKDKGESIRRLLVLQANIGILQNNLSAPVSDRLRKAWTAEIAEKRAEMDKIRNDLGVYVMSFVRGVFPAEDESMSDALRKEYTKFDPTQVHSFDMFINAGKLTGALDPARLAETADLLSQVEIFKGVPVAELENLSRAITTQSFGDGQVLFNQGDTGDTMYIVEDGMIGIFIRDPASPTGEKQISSCQPGDLVGELALLDGSPRSARARALGPLRVLMLRRENFMMFVRSRPLVILALLEYLSKRARRLSDMVEQSVEWASRIAQGDYDGATALSTQLQPAGIQLPVPKASLQRSAVHRSASPEVVSAAGAATTGALPDEKPPSLGVFAMMSSALQEREAQGKADRPPGAGPLRDLPGKPPLPALPTLPVLPTLPGMSSTPASAKAGTSSLFARASRATETADSPAVGPSTDGPAASAAPAAPAATAAPVTHAEDPSSGPADPPTTAEGRPTP